MFDKVKPLYDRVLIERIKMDDKTPGGIIIPDTAKDKAQTGRVIAIGQGRMTQEGKTIPMAVKVGDVVFFGKYSGTETDDTHLIIREDELLGVVEGS